MILSCDKAEALPLLELAKADDIQELGLDNILSDCQFFRLDSAQGVFAYALKQVGNEIWIQAAGGMAKIDLTALGFKAIEQQAAAAGFKSVGFQTRRRGLVKKALAHGFKIDGYILRKSHD
jgi:hypothetical protein